MPKIQETDLRRFFRNQTFDVQSIFDEYKKIILSNTFFNNLDVLREESKFVQFDNGRWHMRPWVFCNDYYNVPGYYPVILTVNNINTFFEFTSEDLYNELIIAPDEDTMIRVLSYSNNNETESVLSNIQ